MREYLRLARLHTAPLETVPAIIGASVATGSLLNTTVGIWAVYGFFYHVAGYSHNSCTDYELGGDKLDGNKQHHPLNTGELEYETAMGYVALLMIGLALYSMTAISYMQSGPIAVVLAAAVVVQILFGVGYNLLNNTTDFKFVLITISHTLVFVISYVASGGAFTWVFGVLTVFMVLWVTFQISVSGEIKDILVDEYNFMHRMGVRVHERTSIGGDRLYPSNGAIVWSMAIHLSMAGALLPIVLYNVQENRVVMGVMSILYFVMVYLGSRIIDNGDYNRDKRVSTMAYVELLALSIFVLAAYPYIHERVTLTLIPLSVAWVVVFNNIQWDTSMRPDV